MSEVQVQLRDTQTLRFRTVAHKNVPRDSVRVNCAVAALVSAVDRDHAALLRRINAMLHHFIPVEWQLASPNRQADSSGYERVTLEANARAPLAENYNLSERARRVSSEGLTILDPDVDHRLPAARVASAVQALRLEILEDAFRQAREFSTADGITWQLGDIEFGVGTLDPGVRNSKGAYRDELRDVDGDQAPEPAAERIRLVAAVVLKAVPSAR